ncbi:MAG: MerC domain-containing protein [Gammaproteobacteria bacterium]|nr:MerC domain-containing protein [Gammaproteobacteria bacterium]
MSAKPINSDFVKSTASQPAWLDKFAVFLSSVCILHCLLTPIAITLLPIIALNVVVEDILFHRAMLWLVLPTSSVALFLGCRKHRSLLIVGVGILGMSMLVLIAFFAHDLLTPTHEKLATSLAGIILAASHVLNYRACQNQPCKDENCSTEHHH